MDPVTARMAVQLATTLARNRGVRYLLAGLIVVSLLSNAAMIFGPWMLGSQLSATLRAQQQTVTDDKSCRPSTEVIDTRAASAGSLSAEQVSNARVIWRVAQQMGAGDRGALIGIATALQESSLRNLSYGDRDSVGLFQQRAGWGSTATRMNPERSARLFYASLADVRGWRAMSVTPGRASGATLCLPERLREDVKSASGLVALFRSKAPASGSESTCRAAVRDVWCRRRGPLPRDWNAR